MHKLTIAVKIDIETSVIHCEPEEGHTEDDALKDAKECKDLDIDLRTRFFIDVGVIIMSGKGVFPRSFAEVIYKEMRRLMYENGYMKDMDGFSEVGTG